MHINFDFYTSVILYPTLYLYVRVRECIWSQKFQQMFVPWKRSRWHRQFRWLYFIFDVTGLQLASRLYEVVPLSAWLARVWTFAWKGEGLLGWQQSMPHMGLREYYESTKRRKITEECRKWTCAQSLTITAKWLFIVFIITTK